MLSEYSDMNVILPTLSSEVIHSVLDIMKWDEKGLARQ